MHGKVVPYDHNNKFINVMNFSDDGKRRAITKVTNNDINCIPTNSKANTTLFSSHQSSTQLPADYVLSSNSHFTEQMSGQLSLTPWSSCGQLGGAGIGAGIGPGIGGECVMNHNRVRSEWVQVEDTSRPSSSRISPAGQNDPPYIQGQPVIQFHPQEHTQETAMLDNMNQSEQMSSDSDSDSDMTHPNKFPVQIENHGSKHCVYRRQPTRSGPKMKQHSSTVYSPMLPSFTQTQVQHTKYYQKDLVRICRCGRYNQMDGALVHGRNNDSDGYEIHYSQKCKWKAYDDFKTGARVLIRLCKCYKPM